MITVAELKKERAECNNEFLADLEIVIFALNKDGVLQYRAHLTDAIDVKLITGVLEMAGFKVEHLKGDGGYGCLHDSSYNYLNISWE